MAKHSKNREKTIKNIKKPSKITKKQGINPRKYQKTVKHEEKPEKKMLKISKKLQNCPKTGKNPSKI